MKRQGFTMLEIVITIVVLGILVTLGYPAYKNIRSDVDKKVCDTNLKALAITAGIDGMERGIMPATLSQLRPESIQKAYAQLLKGKDAWKIKLAYFLVGLRERGLAYAGLLSDIGKGNIALITCPADPTPPAKGGVSYAFNSALAGMSAAEFQKLPADTVIVGDCDTPDPRTGGLLIVASPTTYNKVVAVNDAVNRHVRYANIFSKEYSSRFAVKGGGYNEHIAGEAWLRKLGKNGQSEHKPIICETYSCRQRCLALYLSSPLLQTVRSSLQGNIPGASTLLNECVSNC